MTRGERECSGVARYILNNINHPLKLQRAISLTPSLALFVWKVGIFHFFVWCAVWVKANIVIIRHFREDYAEL
jgi:hypothetical protein